MKVSHWVALRGPSGHFEEHVQVTSQTHDPVVLCHGSHLYIRDIWPRVMRRLEEGESVFGLLAASEKR